MKYSKILILLGVGSIVGFVFVFGVDLQWGNLSKIENIDVNMNSSRAQRKQGVQEFQKPKHSYSRGANNDNSDFYQVIIDNSLFRPLGWTPPIEEPEYALIGTAFDTIGSNSRAFVVERRSNQFYIVSVGDEIGDAVVKEIADKKITLYENGKMLTFNIGKMEYLKTGDSSSQAKSSSEYVRNSESERNNQKRARYRSADFEAQKKRIAKMMKESGKQMKNMMKDVAKVEKDMEKSEYKMLIEKKKVIAKDLKLKK